MNKQEKYPSFIQDYGGLLSHFNNHFADLQPHERGEKFTQFVKKLVPHTPIGEKFDFPQLRQRTHDKGVDLECESKDGREKLCVQSKYTIKDVDEVDEIISKFQEFQHIYKEQKEQYENQPKQLGFISGGFDNQEEDVFPLHLHFMVVTSSDIKGIIKKYEQSRRPSLEFYRDLISNQLLEIVDGPLLVPLLQKTYRKLHVLPSDFKLKFVKDFINMGDVYIGVISGIELLKLFNEFGDALFLENVREFLGSPGDRSTFTDVNKEIVKTLETEPEKFLSKNNGIVFRSSSIAETDSQTLFLSEATIVNGLQTTKAIVEEPSPKCYVLVKVVRTEQHWAVAKAANFQNQINRIDLDLAEYIRPNKIRLAASQAGIGFQYARDDADSIFAVVETIYQDRISYQEVRSLFIGIFSHNPNNTIDPDYGQLRTDIIEELYNKDKEQRIFNILFNIQRLTQRAADAAKDLFKGIEYSNLFQRFWEDAKPKYRAFLTILAVCGSVRRNIYEGKEPSYQELLAFLEDVNRVLENQPDVYIRYYRHAFKSVANRIIAEGGETSSALQKMTRLMHRAKFAPLYKQVCINADDDDVLQNLLKLMSNKK